MKVIKNINFVKLSKNTLIVAYIAMVLVLGIVFAASSGQLAIDGTAEVAYYDNTSTKLPVGRIFNVGGDFEAFTNPPSGISVLDAPATNWDDEDKYYTLYMEKPSTIGTDPTGWDCTMTFFNESNYTFSSGQVSLSGYSGGYWTSGDVSASLDKITVSTYEDFDVTLTFNTTLNLLSVDQVLLTASFEVLGVTKYLYIEVNFIPKNYIVPTITYYYGVPSTGVIYNTNNWTNQNISAVITFNIGGVSVSNSQSGTNTCTFTANGSCTFTYVTPNGSENRTATVDKIDKIAPVLASFGMLTADYTEITVSATATDTGGSMPGGTITGAYCQFSIDDKTSWTPFVNCSGYTYTGLPTGTSYAIHARVCDNADNCTENATNSPSYGGTNTLTGLPIAVDPVNGQYVTFTNMPAGNDILGTAWNGQTFTFVLVKPVTMANSGMQNYSFTTVPIRNASSVQWTGGTATSQIVSGTFNKATAAAPSPTTVPGSGSLTVTVDIQAKVDVAVIDNVKTTVTYALAGISPNPSFYIDFYWIPNAGYMINYDANGGSGYTDASTCPNNTTTCPATISGTSYGVVRPNGFTPPAGKTFKEWNTADDGTGTPITTSIPANTFEPRTFNTLYAIWQ